ncbi:hypothetical protein JTE90_029538 [Oedothorax gibbosus]|uniref:CHHC U11-48K-type domain-containing protein n=1 Tax=Oedothorax gibbosus TaxID=931172 RepID=A0AAV6VB32_9ARAC|nr:hypothetical protein JTE90_029538 [Oedothorax gibbosus]
MFIKRTKGEFRYRFGFEVEYQNIIKILFVFDTSWNYIEKYPICKFFSANMTTHRLVMCPYDEVHKVKESRLQMHITKCRLNHLNGNKFICPFNSTHVYPCQERDYHLANCSDRAPLDRRLAGSLDMNNPYRGRIAVPSYNESPVVVSEEVWDLDSNPTPGYRPPLETPAGVMFMPPPLSKPAERRRMYKNLHLRPDEDEDRPAQTVAAAASPVIPKQPSGPSKLESMQNFANIGKGRGTSKRIAANIFPEQNRPGSTNGHSYDVDALSSHTSQLGLGRGASNHSNDDDEFPALGCGRGMTRAPRNISYAGIMNAGNKQ